MVPEKRPGKLVQKTDPENLRCEWWGTKELFLAVFGIVIFGVFIFDFWRWPPSSRGPFLRDHLTDKDGCL